MNDNKRSINSNLRINKSGFPYGKTSDSATSK